VAYSGSTHPKTEEVMSAFAPTAQPRGEPPTIARRKPDDADDVTERLTNRLDESIPREQVRAHVTSGFAAFQDAVVREFVPLFVERRVRAELRAPDQPGFSRSSHRA